MMVRPAASGGVDVRDTDEVLRAFKEGVDFGGSGSRVHISLRGQDDIATRFLPNPVPAAHGGVDVFVSSDEDSDEDSDADSSFEPFNVLALVEFSRNCSHESDVWPRFAAKVGLGLIALLGDSTSALEDGTPVGECLGPDATHSLAAQLRRIAFGEHCAARHPSHPYATAEPGAPTAEHVIGFVSVDDHAVLLIRLFHHLNYRLDFTDVAVDHPVQVTMPVTKAAVFDETAGA
jgi:hypothetical protein